LNKLRRFFGEARDLVVTAVGTAIAYGIGELLARR
jgi:hypothetical protein